MVSDANHLHPEYTCQTQSTQQTLAYPTYSEIQYIRLAGIFERVDILGVLLWTIGSFLRVSIFTYGASRGVAHLFRAKKEKIYVLPTVFLAGALTITVIPISREAAHEFLVTTFPVIAIFVGVLLPLLTMVVMLFRKQGGQSGNGRPGGQPGSGQPGAKPEGGRIGRTKGGKAKDRRVTN